MSVIDEVKQKVDIVEIVGQYTKLTKAGKTFRGLCPFHTEKHGSFFVYPEQQSWHCFGACNTGGDVLSFIMKKEGNSFGEALQLLAQRAGVTVPSGPAAGERQEEKEALYRLNEAAAQYFHNLLLNSPAAEKVRGYIASRGILPRTAAAFQLGFSLDSWESLKQYLLERNYAESGQLAAGLILQADNGRTHDRFRGRLMFPIRDARGRAIGFGARALDDSMPKYLNSPQSPVFDKSGNLYGIDLASTAIRQQDTAVIVEGYMDVIIAHQCGINNVVASMGTAITEKHIGTLKRLTRNLVLALDADAAGEEAMLRGVGYENRLDTEVRVIILPEGKDPDEVIREDTRIWQRLVAEALPIIDYAFDKATVRLDLTTARDKASAVEKLLPIVAEIRNPVRQAHYLQKLARLVRITERNLEAALAKIRFSPGKSAPQPLKSDEIARALNPVVSSPLEQDCLALLLQYPELKGRCDELSPEYFRSSENREIFIAWLQAEDLSALKARLDAAIHERLDTLISRRFNATQMEQRHINHVLRLRERFLKDLEAKRAEIFALERETKGPGADLARLEEDGIETSQKLREIFKERNQKRSELKG